MNFYHDLITQKSWQLLKKLRQKYDFILIGGWAVYLYTHALKSKDIDLVLEYEELEKLKQEFAVSKNERLKKYEAKAEGSEIDIYLPYYSNPGLPAEDLKKLQTLQEGFKVVAKEVLAILKVKVLLERKDSLKGRKDLIDLVSLLKMPEFDWQKYRGLIKEYDLSTLSRTVCDFLRQTNSLEELGLNPHQMSRLKGKILPLMKV